MEKRTAEIIMICKGQHDYGKDLGYKEAITAYLSDHCGCPIEYYADGTIVNRVILDAALDYIDSINVHRPSSFLRGAMDSYNLHNNPLIDKKLNTDWYEAVCGAFSIAQVKKDGEYINGFTEENTQFVHKSEKIKSSPENKRKKLLETAKPILFNTENVKAILGGLKTETRRIAHINTEFGCRSNQEHYFIRDDFADSQYTGYVCKHCGFGVSPPHTKYPVGSSFIRPQYEIGDILYIRETWTELETVHGVPYYAYKADDDTLHHSAGENFTCWHPSIHMPKTVARTFLQITDVRLERLQDITECGTAKEGIRTDIQSLRFDDPDYVENWGGIQLFQSLWDRTIQPEKLKDFGWSANPWVWVYEFKVI